MTYYLYISLCIDASTILQAVVTDDVASLFMLATEHYSKPTVK